MSSPIAGCLAFTSSLLYSLYLAPKIHVGTPRGLHGSGGGRGGSSPPNPPLDSPLVFASVSKEAGKHASYYGITGNCNKKRDRRHTYKKKRRKRKVIIAALFLSNKAGADLWMA